GAVVDMHANVATDRLRGIDILVGYRTNPHIDTFERGERAAALLREALAGRLRPYRAHRGLPIVAPPSVQATDAEPLRTLWAEADRLQEGRGLADVSIHA